MEYNKHFFSDSAITVIPLPIAAVNRDDDKKDFCYFSFVKLFSRLSHLNCGRVLKLFQ